MGNLGADLGYVSYLPTELINKAHIVIEQCTKRGLKIASAESCTGGLIATALTEIPGSSAVLERSFVTYSNKAKQEMLGVKAETIDAFGAVSEQVAKAMAVGALKNSAADISVAITGIAGPGGATVNKPVGLVHISVAFRERAILISRDELKGNRQQVRLQSARKALDLVLQILSENP
jgi:nicotinamide-nucleotide amidase